MEREELEWWTDASLMGWGAVCRGTKTGGPWSREEQSLHINCLEMLAAFLAFKCFFREEKSIHVHLKMDNASAIAYINKMGEISLEYLVPNDTGNVQRLFHD